MRPVPAELPGPVLVVVPARNRRRLALQAVRSVLDQTYSDLRCLVVDDASADGTAQALGALGDPRLEVVVNEAPMGASAARNLGLGAVKDETWVAFLDSDDLWAPTKLEEQLAALAANPGAGWAATACVNVSVGLDVLYALRMHTGAGAGGSHCFEVGQLRAMLAEENALPAGSTTVMASAALLAEVGGYDTGLTTCEDWDLWAKLARRAPLAYVDAPLAAYRIWSGQSSVDVAAFVRDAARVRARHYAELGPLPRSYAARWQMEAGWRYVTAGRRGRAAASYLRAAWLGRLPGQLAYAAASLADPAAVHRRLDHAQRRGLLPEGWETQARAWLALYRQGPGLPS